MTNTNEMYQNAVAAIYDGHGVSRFIMKNGDTVICSVKSVAGRSITAKHMRTNFLLLKAGEQYSKDTSRAKVVEMLKGE